MSAPSPLDVKPPLMESPPGAETVIDGRSYIYFGGTGYLGLAGHPEVIEALRDAATRFGVHTATSRTGVGASLPLLEVERRAAEFFGTDEAYYFASGYMGPQVIAQMASRETQAPIVCIDEASHPCGQEAARLVSADIRQFRHLDSDSLAALLSALPRTDAPLIVMTDGVFPLTGEIAPLDAYVDLLSSHGRGCLLVDDAHGVGVLGDRGRGSLEWREVWDRGVNAELRSPSPQVFLCGTLSKAVGGFGGIIPASTSFLDCLRHHIPGYAGASAPPSPVAAATEKALEILMREPGLRRNLRRNATRLKTGLRALGLPVSDSPTAHVGLPIGDQTTMLRLHEALKKQGFLVPYLRTYPGVGSEGIMRFAVFATHTPEMIDDLLALLRRLL